MPVPKLFAVRVLPAVIRLKQTRNSCCLAFRNGGKGLAVVEPEAQATLLWIVFSICFQSYRGTRDWRFD
jgi:hypothetical protein